MCVTGNIIPRPEKSEQEFERKFARPQLPASGLAIRHKLSVAFAGIVEETPFGFSLSQR